MFVQNAGQQTDGKVLLESMESITPEKKIIKTNMLILTGKTGSRRAMQPERNRRLTDAVCQIRDPACRVKRAFLIVDRVLSTRYHVPLFRSFFSMKGCQEPNAVSDRKIPRHQ
jgi:hypothetical protein